MNGKLQRLFIANCLILGALLGMAGTFVTDPSFRGLLWGLDGTLLVIASAWLTVFFIQQENSLTAAGFLIYAIGQGFVLAYSGIDPSVNTNLFGTGTALWGTSMLLISSQKVYPLVFRITGGIGGLLFLMVSVHIFYGDQINALSKPLPFFAYPFLAITLIGWAFSLWKIKEPK